MLQVRSGSSRAAEHCRIEHAAPRSEQRERRETAADLEAKVVDVVVRHAVAGEVDERPEKQRDRSRAGERSGSGSGSDMKGDDHFPIFADGRMLPRMNLGSWIRGLFSTSSDSDDPSDAPDAIVAGGPMGLGGLEATQAAEDALEATERPDY